MPNPDEYGQEQPSWGKALPIPMLLQGQPRIRPSSRLIGALLVAAFATGTVFSSFYTVQPTEMADARRLGTVLTAEPVGPGLHMKPPWIDVVNTIQVSLDVFQLNNLTVYTTDNQPVTVGIGMSYRIPHEAVLKLLHGVGRTGNIDITENIRPVLADRVLRVFSLQNTVNISANREQVATAIRKGVADGLGSIFGLEVTDLQLSSITYSPSFQASVEAAVQAKNDAIRAENTVSKVRFEGEQAKVKAEAQASARIAQAKGESEAAIPTAGTARCRRRSWVAGQAHLPCSASRMRRVRLPYGDCSLPHVCRAAAPMTSVEEGCCSGSGRRLSKAPGFLRFTILNVRDCMMPRPTPCLGRYDARACRGAA